jgi:hypothetical protein
MMVKHPAGKGEKKSGGNEALQIANCKLQIANCKLQIAKAFPADGRGAREAIL